MTPSDPAADGKRQYLVDLFPFARPVSHYVGVLKNVCRAESASHLVLLSRTAHPAALVAGRECGLEVTAFFGGVRQHSVAHGQALLEEIFIRKNMSQARSDVGPVRKRVRSTELQYITIRAPDTQTIELRDVQINSGSWREGLNRIVDDLPSKTVSLLQAEWDAYSMTLTRTPQGQCLAYSNPLKEGQYICPLSAVFFDAHTALEAFLNAGGNKILGDRVVCIENVRRGPETGTVWAVLVGAGRFLRHYLGVRRAGANATIELDLSKGAKDGCLGLRVRTRNGQGIAAKSPIVVNFGPGFDIARTAEADEPEMKKFRGAIEQYFKKREWEEATEREEHAQSGSGAVAGGTTPAGTGVTAVGGVTPPGTGGAAVGGMTPPGTGASGSGTAAATTGSAASGSRTTTGSAPMLALPAPPAATPAVQPAGTPAAKAPLLGLPEPPAATPAVQPAVQPAAKAPTVASPDGAQEGTILAQNVEPAGCSLILRQGFPESLWLKGGGKGSKKVPPETPLLLIRDGTKLEKVLAAPLIPYAFDKPKKARVAEVAGPQRTLSAVMRLDALITKTKATGIVKHGTFPAGQAPASLTPPRGYGCIIADAKQMAACRVAKGLGCVEVLWVFRAEDKQLTPYGVVLVTTKQLVVPAAPSSLQLV